MHKASRGHGPQGAWLELMEGNARFVSAQLEHPNIDVGRRVVLTEAGQAPHAAVLACADSRVPVEIVFDQGLGDMFVVRNAGQISGLSILASLEFAVDTLQVPLIVVLGHQYCGAVAAAEEAIRTGNMPTGFQSILVEKVAPSVMTAQALGMSSATDIERHHVKLSTEQLVTRSPVVQRSLRRGTLGVVGAHYDLEHGTVNPVIAYGVEVPGVEAGELP